MAAAIPGKLHRLVAAAISVKLAEAFGARGLRDHRRRSSTTRHQAEMIEIVGSGDRRYRATDQNARICFPMISVGCRAHNEMILGLDDKKAGNPPTLKKGMVRSPETDRGDTCCARCSQSEIERHTIAQVLGRQRAGRAGACHRPSFSAVATTSRASPVAEQVDKAEENVAHVTVVYLAART